MMVSRDVTLAYVKEQQGSPDQASDPRRPRLVHAAAERLRARFDALFDALFATTSS